MKPIVSAVQNSTVWIVLGIAIALFRSTTTVSAMTLPKSPSATTTTTTAEAAAAPAAAPPDTAMEATYDRLARHAIDLYRSGKGTGLDGRCWIGIAGGPGAGKSTLASAVADKICELAEAEQPGTEKSGDPGTEGTGSFSSSSSSPAIRAVAVPMDGYHYTRKKLAEVAETLGGGDDNDDGTKGMSRRGAPWTFDAAALARDLGQAKRSGRASLPEYDRSLSDPVDDAVAVEESHRIILVEGNYLILGRVEAEIDGDNGDLPLPGSNLAGACSDLRCPVPVGEEVRRWKDAAALWDETWFVAPPGNRAVEIQRDRIIERSLETWNPSKTEAWGGGTDREAAIRRAEFNDVRNARLVECCRAYADRIVDSI